jgi:hypothetical protein
MRICCLFYLFVLTAVLILPQDCLRGKLSFAAALRFCVCFGVG